MKVNEFFDEVYSGHLSDVDIYNAIEKLTDGYDKTKLNLLCRDFDFYSYMKKEEFLGSFSHEEIEKKMHELEKAGKKVPMISESNRIPLSVSHYFKIPEHKKIKKEKDWTYEELKELDKFFSEMVKTQKVTIDVERLMDPYGFEFFLLHRLKSLLVDLKRKHTDAVYRFDDKEFEVNNIQPIHWLKGDDSLRRLIDLLKDAGFIEKKDTDEIIQEHFKHSDQTPQLIQWKRTNRLLIYLFMKLNETDMVDTMNRQHKLIVEHFLNQYGKPLKGNSLKQEVQNMKLNGDPNGSNTIDGIIKELSE